jgi:hypothetical protein
MDPPPPPHVPSITSKLVLVAELMDQSLRQDNTNFFRANRELGVQYRLLLDQYLASEASLRQHGARIRELEFDLRSALDHNERLVEFNYTLEVSILDCDHHAHIVPNAVARRLSFGSDIIDLTSDEELLTDPEDVEL